MNIKEILTKDLNTTKILKSIIKNQPISRADLAKLNNLNKTTTSAIVANIIDTSIVHESGLGESTFGGGRKPILLEFNSKAAVAISIEIGPNYIYSALAYLDGEIIVTDKTKNVVIDDQTIHQLLETSIDELITKKPQTPNGLAGIAVAIHGVSVNNKFVFSPFYDIKNYNLYEKLTQQYECPVYIENESNLAALGEHAYGTCQDRIININIQSGIGAGIIDNGKMQKGTHGRIGEIGHTILFPGGRDCACGNKGCLERYASLDVLCSNISEQKDISNVSIEEIISLWNDKNDIVVEAVLTNIQYLSIGINNLISLYDPDEIIINSPLFIQIPELLTHLKESLHSQLFMDTELSISKLEDKATLYGGINLVSLSYLNIDNIKFLLN